MSQGPCCAAGANESRCSGREGGNPIRLRTQPRKRFTKNRCLSRSSQEARSRPRSARNPARQSRCFQCAKRQCQGLFRGARGKAFHQPHGYARVSTMGARQRPRMDSHVGLSALAPVSDADPSTGAGPASQHQHPRQVDGVQGQAAVAHVQVPTSIPRPPTSRRGRRAPATRRNVRHEPRRPSRNAVQTSVRTFTAVVPSTALQPGPFSS